MYIYNVLHILLPLSDENLKEKVIKSLKSPKNTILEYYHIKVLSALAPIALNPETESNPRVQKVKETDQSPLSFGDLYNLCRQCLVNRLEKGGKRDNLLEVKVLEVLASITDVSSNRSHTLLYMSLILENLDFRNFLKLQENKDKILKNFYFSREN